MSSISETANETRPRNSALFLDDLASLVICSSSATVRSP